MNAATKFTVLVLLSFSQITHGQWQALDVFDNGYVTHLDANDDYLFAATKGGVFRSNNPEEGWEKLDAGDEIHDHWKVQVFDDVVFSLVHLQKATNNGDSGFEMVIWEEDYPYDFRFMAQKGDTLIAKRFNGNTLFTSTDMGDTWSPLGLFPTSMRKIVTDDDYFYLIENHQFQRTQDFSEFELLSEDFPITGFTDEWQDALVTDNSILILQENGTILYSDNQGSSMQYAQTPDVLGNDAYINDWDYHGNSVVASVVSPVRGVLRSEDAGLTWEFFPVSLPYPLVSVAFFQGEVYVAPQYSGVRKLEFTEDGLELTPSGSGITVASADDMARSGDHIYIHRKYDNIYQSETQLGTVAPVNGLPPIDWEFDQVAIADNCVDGAMVGIGDEQTQYVYKLHEDTEWSEISSNSILGSSDVSAFQIVGDTVLLQTYALINYSIDGGDNWSALLDIMPFAFGNTALLNNGRLFFSDNFNGTGFTEDFGQNLIYPGINLGQSFGPDPAHTMLSYGNNLLFLSYNKRAISQDNGDTWTSLDNPSRFEVAYARDSIVVAAWRGRDVYVSSDFGVNFEPVDQDNSGLPMYATYNNVFFDNSRIYLSVKNGNIYYTSPIDLGLMPFTSIDEKPNRDLTLYPNPASDRIWFEPFQQSVKLSVYSVQGQLLDQITLQPNTNSIDINHLPVGIYLMDFLNLNGERVTQSKLLIQR